MLNGWMFHDKYQNEFIKCMLHDWIFHIVYQNEFVKCMLNEWVVHIVYLLLCIFHEARALMNLIKKLIGQ